MGARTTRIALGLVLVGCGREPTASDPDEPLAREVPAVPRVATEPKAAIEAEPVPAQPEPEPASETDEPETDEPEPKTDESQLAAPVQPKPSKRGPNRSVHYLDCVRSCTNSSPLAEFGEAAARADCEDSCK